MRKALETRLKYLKGKALGTRLWPADTSLRFAKTHTRTRTQINCEFIKLARVTAHQTTDCVALSFIIVTYLFLQHSIHGGKGRPCSERTGRVVGMVFKQTTFFTLALGERNSKPSLEDPAQGPLLWRPAPTLKMWNQIHCSTCSGYWWFSRHASITQVSRKWKIKSLTIQ